MTETGEKETVINYLFKEPQINDKEMKSFLRTITYDRIERAIKGYQKILCMLQSGNYDRKELGRLKNKCSALLNQKDFGYAATEIDVKQTLYNLKVALSGCLLFTIENSRLIRTTQLAYHFGWKFRVLPPRDQYYSAILEYFNSTQGPTHTSATMLYAIENEHVQAPMRFDGEVMGNRMLLWHGSRVDNVPSILKYGLMINPKRIGLPVDGMFGNGLYFTDCSTKAANYSIRKGKGCLLLCEVALGRVLDAATPDASPLTSAHDSRKGIGTHCPTSETQITGARVPVGPLKKMSKQYLLYNEYCVYKECQVKIKYLVMFAR